MKWIDPRFNGFGVRPDGTSGRLPPKRVTPADFAEHTDPPTKKGRRAGEPRKKHLVPIYALIPVATGKLYR